MNNNNDYQQARRDSAIWELSLMILGILLLVIGLPWSLIASLPH